VPFLLWVKILKIGIFWFYKNEVIGIAHELKISEADSLGMIDSHYEHISYWNKLRCKYSELREIEYEEIPRGRVVFNKNKNKLIIYLDKKLLKKEIVYKIYEFFNSDKYLSILMSDPHYRT